MEIQCCQCQKPVEARLTDGREIYPHRPDLGSLPFWKCDTCGNYVGCHHKTDNPTRPLGIIPTPELRNARKHIHALLDPLWQSGKWKRKALYQTISEKLGWTFHTSKIRDLPEARKVYGVIRDINTNTGE